MACASKIHRVRRIHRSRMTLCRRQQPRAVHVSQRSSTACSQQPRICMDFRCRTHVFSSYSGITFLSMRILSIR